MRVAPPLSLLLAVASLSSLALARPAAADDWPQYRGPNRDDVSAERGLLKQWPAGGPRLLWTYADAGVGYAGPAVVGDRLYTLGARGGDEFLIALDVGRAAANADVKQAWATRVGATFGFPSNQWSAGPSATPTIDGDLVFALGGNGDLLCADRADGKELWRVNLPTDLSAEVNPIGGGPKKLGWGFTWSPLVDGERLVCVPGGPKGTVAALDKRTGKVLWRSSDATDQAAYASPMLMVVDGVRQYVVLTNQGLIGVAADDGRMLWRHRQSPAYRTEVVNSPVVKGDRVFVTVGASHGCEVVRVRRDADAGTGAFAAELVYANKGMANHHGNVVLVGDHVYGHSQGGGWTCVAFDTGEVAWSDRGRPPGDRAAPGAITYADGRFYNVAERDGAVALIDATPAGSTVVGRVNPPKPSASRKPKGGVWTPPVVSGGRLFVRDQELLFCYDVSAAPTP